MHDPNSIEVDEEMEERAPFVIRLGKDPLPLNLVEFHEALAWWDIYKAGLVGRNLSQASTQMSTN